MFLNIFLILVSVFIVVFDVIVVYYWNREKCYLVMWIYIYVYVIKLCILCCGFWVKKIRFLKCEGSVLGDSGFGFFNMLVL